MLISLVADTQRLALDDSVRALRLRIQAAANSGRDISALVEVERIMTAGLAAPKEGPPSMRLVSD
ncbi:hypothetical protein LL251_17160 [Sphingobium naphthae]|nr:hypothetical protein [Sphingobium naphthae]